jgi:type IV fimbrial biogenesis protein FimT
MGRREHGMSIIEILVAISIVGIVMAFAAPSALTWIQNTQLRNAADSVLNGLQTARLEALKRNTAVAFELTDPLTTAWRVCFFDAATLACSTTQPDLANRSASEGSPNARVAVETVFTDFATPLAAGTNVPALVAFDSLGRISPASPVNIARVDVRNPVLSAADERRLAIAVGAGGQVRMCDPKLVRAANPQGCQ